MFSRILVAIDTTPHSEAILEQARDLEPVQRPRPGRRCSADPHQSRDHDQVGHRGRRCPDYRKGNPSTGPYLTGPHNPARGTTTSTKAVNRRLA